MAPDYAFRPMISDDLPAIRQWLARSHVREWWGDPSEQYDLVSGDLDEPAMDQFIVSAGSNEFAYLQCYHLTAWDSGFGEQPGRSRL
jgi:aminoglycoside 6'-N-acetyltransferase